MAKKKFSLKRRLQRMSKRQKIRFSINCVLIFLCILCIGVFVYAYPRLKRVSESVGMIKTEKVEDPDRVVTDDDGYWTILILGLDSRDADGVNDMSTTNFGDKRSDCMILVSLDRETKEVKLVSVYRDTVLQMRDIDFFESGNYCYSKATHAYSWGSANTLPSNDEVDAGPYYTMDMLERNLDIQIDNFVTVNFGVVADVINALGGVTLEIAADEAAVINPYIQEINEITGSNSEYIYSAGTYTLDGTQATAFGRIRYTAGDDYKRTERQREVLMLAAQKAKTAGIDPLIDVLSVVAPSIRTDLTMDEMNELITKYAISFELDPENGQKGFPFEKATKSGDSYVYPVDLDSNVIELHKYLYGDENYTVPVGVQNISDYIADMYYYGGSSSSNSDDSTWYDDEDETPEVIYETEEPIIDVTEEPVYDDEPEVPEHTSTQEPYEPTEAPIIDVTPTEEPVIDVIPTEEPVVITPEPEIPNDSQTNTGETGGETGGESTEIEIPLELE